MRTMLVYQIFTWRAFNISWTLWCVTYGVWCVVCGVWFVLIIGYLIHELLII